jgi:mannose-6-phosphate isomerase-like protein (cupin superfamily)
VVHKYKEQEVYNTQHHHQLEDIYFALSHDVAAAVEQHI